MLLFLHDPMVGLVQHVNLSLARRTLIHQWGGGDSAALVLSMSRGVVYRASVGAHTTYTIHWRALGLV